MFTSDEEIKKIKDELTYTRKNVYEVLDDAALAEMEAYSEDYKSFLDQSKTEREAVIASIAAAEAEGYIPYHFGDSLTVGGKYYYNNRGRQIFLFTIGTEPLENGLRISAAHIDSPRIDLKQHPVYEDGNLGFFKTHYYGGIKKYQWTSIPLAMHGVVVKADGSSVEIVIGESESDPVFYIDDLLPHLAKDQVSHSLGEGIPGEKLNILVGSKPISAHGDIKLGILQLLHNTYGITESDFISADISLVPAFKARDIGFDRSLIGGYGHDDRVCSYPALTALLSVKDPVHSLMVILADKEEVGSGGATGMQTDCFTSLVSEIAAAMGANYHKVMANSKCLSADVNAAYDPNFADVYEYKNSCFINEGVVMTKYTGSRGKSGTNDATAEFVGEVRKIFDEADVVWQTGELGKVDQGGGGTVAIYLAGKNIDVVDLGVPVLSMHSPYEVIAKADLYMTYKAFLAFNQ
jgi:aspartyl aminopeptidase